MKIFLIVSISVVVIALLLWTKPDTYTELRSPSPSTVKIEIVKQVEIQLY